METEKLTTIRKELLGKPFAEVVEFCLQFARLKKENKELLHYLLYESADPLEYAEKIKEDLSQVFQELPAQPYQMCKVLRKQIRVITKYARFTRNKEGELSLLLFFLGECSKAIAGNIRFTAFFSILERVEKKCEVLLDKLHEDLRFDYEQILQERKSELRSHFRNFG